MANDLTRDRLASIVRYDPETGIFTFLQTRTRAKSGAVAGNVRRNARGQAYLSMEIDGKAYLAHRLAWLYMTGEWPTSLVDHKDRDSLNNRWSNLRAASKSENQANRKRRADNSSGFKGVSPHHGKWRARISKDNQRDIIGVFDTPQKAHAAYLARAKATFGEFARGS